MTKREKVKELTREWLRKSKEDLLSAKTLLDASEERLEFLISAIGFHSQQSVEKSLKAYLIYKQIDFSSD